MVWWARVSVRADSSLFIGVLMQVEKGRWWAGRCSGCRRMRSEVECARTCWQVGRICRSVIPKVGIAAGDPIFVSPSYRVDPLLARYGQSTKCRSYTTETRRNYATDISLLLTFLWSQDKSWTAATVRDLEDYEHWRRFASTNPKRIAGAEWDRKLSAFTSLYGWAVAEGYVLRSPVSMKQVMGRDGTVVTMPAARAE